MGSDAIFFMEPMEQTQTKMVRVWHKLTSWSII